MLKSTSGFSIAIIISVPTLSDSELLSDLESSSSISGCSITSIMFEKRGFSITSTMFVRRSSTAVSLPTHWVGPQVLVYIQPQSAASTCKAMRGASFTSACTLIEFATFTRTAAKISLVFDII